MAVTYGFFDSVNGDRTYNADQMSKFYNGIVTSGVFQHVEGGLAVSAGSGMTVSVATGRAVVNNRWVDNSAALTLSIGAASSTYARIDAVVIKLSMNSRFIDIYVKAGEAASSPVAPTMDRADGVYEMALAYVNVAAGATSVTVTDKRSDSAVCGWASVAQATSGEVDQTLNDMKTGFDGVVYDSPAAMVRGSDETIQNELDYITTPSTNLLYCIPVSGTSSGIEFSVNNRNYIEMAGTVGTVAAIDIRLRKVISLSKGTYTLSIQSGSISKTGTITIYLMNSGGTEIAHANIQDSGIQTFVINSDAVVHSVLIRCIKAESVIAINGYLQLESGVNATDYVQPISAYDLIARDNIKLIDDTIKNKIFPIFFNGDTSNGIPVYNNFSTCAQWCVTDRIYKVKAGSMIQMNGNNSFYCYILQYDSSGAYQGPIFSGNVTKGWIYKFVNDTNIRITVRLADYSYITPQKIYENFTFTLYSNSIEPDTANILFMGGTGGQDRSEQAIIIRLPNGKNLMIDSGLLAYWNGTSTRLRNFGVRRIDYYVQTHYHEDHVGILNILDQAPTRIDITNSTFFLPPTITEESIAQVAQTGDDPETLVERQTKMLQYCQTNNCTVIHPSENTRYDLGDGLSLEFYNTDHSIYSVVGGPYYSTNYNDWSICPQLLYGLNVINFSADIGPIGQRAVGGKCYKANILTAPHHGWDNGANNLIPKYINNVNPDVVISTNGWEHDPDNTDSPANIMKASSAMQSYCEANGVSNYPTNSNGLIRVDMTSNGWMFNGKYTRFIRNNKNWSYTDNSEHIEN